jgi:hypothetical protein
LSVDVGGVVAASGVGTMTAILPACGSAGFAAGSTVDFEADGDGDFQIYVDRSITGEGATFVGSWKGANIIMLGPSGAARIWCDGKQWHAIEV